MTDRWIRDVLDRDRWLRRLRRVGVVVPVVGALAATGLAGILARHDSAAAAATTSRSTTTSSSTPSTAATPSTAPTPPPAATTPPATTSAPHHRHRHAKKHAAHTPKPTLTSAPTQAPATHSGGS